MKYQLSFATLNLIASNIVVIFINKNVEVSLEMLDELDELIAKLFPQEPFGVLMNKVYFHRFSFEVKLCMGSYENLAAFAVVNYSEQALNDSKSIQALRRVDNWNIKNFSGLELGWQEAEKWLNSELQNTELMISQFERMQNTENKLSA
jgi:hypothetical protein